MRDSVLGWARYIVLIGVLCRFVMTTYYKLLNFLIYLESTSNQESVTLAKVHHFLSFYNYPCSDCS